jgi:hypothetical protein
MRRPWPALGCNFTKKKVYDRARNKFTSLIGALGSCEVRSPDRILLTLEFNLSIVKNQWSLEHLRLVILNDVNIHKDNNDVS